MHRGDVIGKNQSCTFTLDTYLKLPTHIILPSSRLLVHAMARRTETHTSEGERERDSRKSKSECVSYFKLLRFNDPGMHHAENATSGPQPESRTPPKPPREFLQSILTDSNALTQVQARPSATAKSYHAA